MTVERAIIISFIIFFITVMVVLYLYFDDQFEQTNKYESEIKITTGVAIILYIITQILLQFQEFHLSAFGLCINCIAMLFILWQEIKSK